MTEKNEDMDNLPDCEELNRKHAAVLADAKRRFPDEEI